MRLFPWFSNTVRDSVWNSWISMNIKANFQISIWIFAPKRYQTCCKNETFLPFSNTKNTVSFIATYYTQKYVKDESSTLWKAHRGSTHYCTRKMFPQDCVHINSYEPDLKFAKSRHNVLFIPTTRICKYDHH